MASGERVTSKLLFIFVTYLTKLPAHPDKKISSINPIYVYKECSGLSNSVKLYFLQYNKFTGSYNSIIIPRENFQIILKYT